MAHIINLLIRLHKTITLKPAIFSSHGQPSTLVFNVKGRIHFSIVARVRSRYKEILFNWTGCLHGFSTTASSPGSAHARVKPNRLAETNRGTLDKLFIEKQGVGGQKRSDTVYKKVLKRKKNEKKKQRSCTLLEYTASRSVSRQQYCYGDQSSVNFDDTSHAKCIDSTTCSDEKAHGTLRVRQDTTLTLEHLFAARAAGTGVSAVYSGGINCRACAQSVS